MSKFIVRADHNGKVRLVEFDRQAQFNLDVLEKALIQAFELPGVELRYAPSPSTQQVLRQEFHLENAFKDTIVNRRRFFDLTVVSSVGGAPRAAAPASSAAASGVSSSSSSSAAAAAAASVVAAAASPSSSRLATQSSGSRLFDAVSGAGASDPLAGTSAVKYCGNCGSAVVGGKFCSSCGKPVVAPLSSEAPANLSPSLSGLSGLSGRLAASERKNRRVSAPYPKAAATNKNSCAGCGLAVGLDGVSALEKLWHKDCFVCFMCNTTLLDKGFKRYEDAPVCSDCYSEATGLKCGACQKIISSAYMEIQGKNYYPECFVCSKCTSPFVGGSYLRGKSGEFLCKPCAQAAL